MDNYQKQYSQPEILAVIIFGECTLWAVLLKLILIM